MRDPADRVVRAAAKWADGKPITCDDFEFTRNAIINTKGTYGTAGYDSIDKIDCSDESVAVLNYKTVYTDWYDVFGGSTGVVLEKAAFPNESFSEIRPKPPRVKRSWTTPRATTRRSAFMKTARPSRFSANV